MIQFAGAIKGCERSPYIYAIAKGYCLYIGETQRLPVSRWGEHLAPQGSFMRRLKEADEEVWKSSEEVLCLGVHCEQIASLPQEEQKIVTQYVEHKVHERCILNQHLLVPFETIISDTLRTAPGRCFYSWADQLAEDVFEVIRAQLGYSVNKLENH